jgi:hypothetical protein
MRQATASPAGFDRLPCLRPPREMVCTFFSFVKNWLRYFIFMNRCQEFFGRAIVRGIFTAAAADHPKDVE